MLRGAMPNVVSQIVAFRKIRITISAFEFIFLPPKRTDRPTIDYGVGILLCVDASL